MKYVLALIFLIGCMGNKPEAVMQKKEAIISTAAKPGYHQVQQRAKQLLIYFNQKPSH